MSRLDLLVGPNGAGKTTLFSRIIQPARPGLPFVNADVIAARRWPDEAESRSYDAAQIATRTRAALVESRLDFATETVFSHDSKLTFVEHAVDQGYDVVLHVLLIPLTLSVARVQLRQDQGGHRVPPEKLAPRYERLWPLVAEAIPSCRLAVCWDNSTDDGPHRVASFRHGTPDVEPRWPSWTPEALVDLSG